MHPNQTFRQTSTTQNLDFARDQGFGVLTIAPDGVPLMSHIPVLIDADGTWAEFHLVRSNPIARALDTPRAARIAIQGPHGYVSPDWYDVPDQVPTWNYVAVHLVGTVEIMPPKTLRDVIDRQAAAFEDRLLPKTPWTNDKMTPDVLAKMMRAIVPARMRIAQVEGTWKLNQNKDDAVRLTAAGYVEAHDLGQETALLAALMRGVPARG